ncbi:MAG: hypothetical protein MZV65_27985 [Chromatiales bacterium]|nr:hypothetical protein [Chromatiales bacterium]
MTFVIGLVVTYKATYLDGSLLPEEVRQDDYTFRPFERLFQTTDFSGHCVAGDDHCRAMSLAAGGYRGVPEYETRWRGPESRAYAKGGLDAECRRLNIDCNLIERLGNGLRWRIATPIAVTLRLPVYHFPA